MMHHHQSPTPHMPYSPSTPLARRTEVRPLHETMRLDTEMEAKANVPQMAVAYEPTLPNLLQFRVALIDQGNALMALLESVEAEIDRGGMPPKAA